MNLQPQLKGTLLSLRPLEQKDFDALFKTASDPLIWEQHPQPDRYKKVIFEKFFKEALDSRGALVIIDSKSAEIIGTTRFYEYSKERREVAIGYTFLIRKYWGGVIIGNLKGL